MHKLTSVKNWPFFVKNILLFFLLKPYLCNRQITNAPHGIGIGASIEYQRGFSLMVSGRKEAAYCLGSWRRFRQLLFRPARSKPTNIEI